MGIDLLLAVARVRGILLELGVEFSAEMAGANVNVGAIEVWVTQPHPHLEGRAPVEALRGDDGEARIRSILRQLVLGPSRATGTEIFSPTPMPLQKE